MRIYCVFSCSVVDPEVIAAMLSNNGQYSNRDLINMAWKDAQQGGKGRANAVLTLKLNCLKEAYNLVPIEKRSLPIQVEEHKISESVLALLDDVDQLKYEHHTE